MCTCVTTSRLDVKFYLMLCTYLHECCSYCVHMQRNFSPLDSAIIELCRIMASKIEDVGLWYQICEHETIDEFHNIT